MRPSILRGRPAAPPPRAPTIPEEPEALSPPYTSFTGTPNHGHADLEALLTCGEIDNAVDVMESAAAELAFEATSSLSLPLAPLGPSRDLGPVSADHVASIGIRIDENTYVVDATAVANQLGLLGETLAGELTSRSLPHSYYDELFDDLRDMHLSLRADSPGAPDTHRQAMEMGEPWPAAEDKEMGNHARNGSWSRISIDVLPRGRRLHKLVWVYKLKRDGTAKARLCVQGCTLESGVDFDQTFSQTLRHSSARCLFAYAARNRCYVRSIDYVAAYLQGDFVEGEAVYCHMPPGYEKRDSKDRPYVLRIEKPIYGIPQAGRRLQRRSYPWMKDVAGLRQLDDSDGSVFVYDDPKGSETFAIGIYVDNLQIVHSAALDKDGDAIDGDSFYAKFISLLRRDWDIVDEGPMHDLLAIEMVVNNDESITLHQESYIRALLAKYLPDGPPAHVQKNSLPYSPELAKHVSDAQALPLGPNGAAPFPALVKPYQQKLGSLMYLTTSTRCDITYPVHLLARAMARPTPELVDEVDRVFAYLARQTRLGLTYTPGASTLHGQSDASWEVRFSTSGWAIYWQSAVVAWGSRKQDSVALSSCEAEIIALSEASKDMVFHRRLVSGISKSHVNGPTPLATDNKAARDLAFNPEHHNRTKHVERRHFYVRDMVEKFELTVPFVGTADNTSDFFTKCLNASRFFALRAILMNEPRPPPT